jgi:hypothetical protein
LGGFTGFKRFQGNWILKSPARQLLRLFPRLQNCRIFKRFPANPLNPANPGPS